MTSVFTLCFCLVARILFVYLVKTYHFFWKMQNIMEITVKVFGVLCIVSAVWALSMLIWELVKQITKVKSVNNPIINNYYGVFEKQKGQNGGKKKDEKEFPIEEPIWDDYDDGGYYT